MVVILLGAILLFLGFAALLWWAFGPRDEWHVEHDNDYEIRSLFGRGRERR